MMSIFDPEHPHYSVFKTYVEGGYADPKNPPTIQAKYRESYIKGDWRDLAIFSTESMATYRIKPKMLSRTVIYPEPLRIAPAQYEVFWYVIPGLASPARANWVDSTLCNTLLENGVCFVAEEDARACYDALFGGDKE